MRVKNADSRDNNGSYAITIENIKSSEFNNVWDKLKKEDLLLDSFENDAIWVFVPCEEYERKSDFIKNVRQVIKEGIKCSL